VTETVGVVGAGVTGLSLVHHLRERNVPVRAFEADADPGGVVRSALVDGRVLEHGPQRIRLTDPVAELVDAVGLRDDLLEADDSLPLYVYRDGRLRRVPRSISTFVRTDLLSVRGKLRVLVEPLTADAEADERVATAFRRKFGDEAYRYVVEPLFSGIYASDPTEMRVGHSLSGLLRVEAREGSLLFPALRRARGGTAAPPVSFTGGLGQFTRALYDAHADRVALSTPVTGVRTADGDGYVVETPNGETTVGDLVVTASAPDAAALFEAVAPDVATGLRELTYNPVAMVYLRSDVNRAGFGFQVAAGEPLRLRGVTFNASLFDRDGVYTVFYGGMRDTDVVELSDKELTVLARREFRTALDAPEAAVDVLGTNRVTAYPAYDTTWTALDDLDLPEGLHLATNYTARIGVPSRVREARTLAEELADRQTGGDGPSKGAETGTVGTDSDYRKSLPVDRQNGSATHR
jgi:oxygen-dependent protoporphyrinogen oxidase